MQVVAMKARSTEYEVSVHKVGCADIERRERRGGIFGQMINRYASVDAMYDALLDDGDESAPGYLSDEIRVYPCCHE